MSDAVIFDLDGVLIDSEPVWERARRDFVREHGGRYSERATREIMGMSAPEWAHYLRVELGVRSSEEAINDGIVALVAAAYRAALPLFPGAVAAVRRMSAAYPLAIASSSNRSLIDLVLELAGLTDLFAATVSSEEAGRGKPAPDVYLRAAHGLGVDPHRCGAVEDSTNGLRAAKAAGCFTVAIPNRAYPPSPEALALADAVVAELDDLNPQTFA